MAAERKNNFEKKAEINATVIYLNDRTPRQVMDDPL